MKIDDYSGPESPIDSGLGSQLEAAKVFTEAPGSHNSDQNTSSTTISPLSELDYESPPLSLSAERDLVNLIDFEDRISPPGDDDMILFGKHSQLDDIKLVTAYIEKHFGDKHKAVDISDLKLHSNHFHLRREDGTEIRVYKNHVEMLTKCILTTSMYREQFYAEVRARLGPHWIDLELSDIYTLDPMDGPSFTLFSRENILEGGRRAAEIKIGRSKRVITGTPEFYKVLNNVVRGLIAKFELNEVNGTYYHKDRPDVFNTRVGPIELRFGYSIGTGVHDQGRIQVRVDTTFEYFGGGNNILFMLNGASSIEEAQKRFCGNTIKSVLNNKMYLIFDFDWTLTPKSSVILIEDGKLISPIEQYRRIGIQVSRYQPLMRCVEINENDVTTSNGKAKQVLLVPEMHQLVGLLDEMKDELKTAKDYEISDPKTRYSEICDFKYWFTDHPGTNETLSNLGLKIVDFSVKCNAVVLPKVKLLFGNGQEKPDTFGRWASALNDYTLAEPVELVEWSLVYVSVALSPTLIDEALHKMKEISSTLGFKARHNYQRRIELPNHDIFNYVAACETLGFMARREFSFILVCIPKDGASELESEVRKALRKRMEFYHEIVIRFLVIEDIIDNDLLTRHFIADVNVSLGGIPWTVDFGFDAESIEGLMIVGFDKGHTFTKKVSTCDTLYRIRKKPLAKWQSVIVGATVSSVNNNFSKYFKHTFTFDRDGEMGNLVKLGFMKALRAYQIANNEQLPSRIIYYRDSVSDAELDDVKQIELDQLLSILTMRYEKNVPEFTYVVTNRASYTKLFDTAFNFAPIGTVVDSTITFANRNDFYLISTGEEPTYYQVIHDTSKLGLRAIESLTYKFCHLSFDEFESTRVPAPVHNASKVVADKMIELKL